MTADAESKQPETWLNLTVLSIGLASLFSDWAHEIATTVLPAFLATMCVAAAWFGGAMRTLVRKALLAGSVTPETYGRAFGLERMMDTLGTIVGPATALVLLVAVNHHYPALFALTLIPGLLAVAAITFLVRERERKPVPHILFGARLRALLPRYRKFPRSKGRPGSQPLRKVTVKRRENARNAFAECGESPVLTRLAACFMMVENLLVRGEAYVKRQQQLCGSSGCQSPSETATFFTETTARPAPIGAACVLVSVGTWLCLEGERAGSRPFLFRGAAKATMKAGKNEKAKNAENQLERLRCCSRRLWNGMRSRCANDKQPGRTRGG